MESISRFFRRIIFFYKQSSVISDWRVYLMFDFIPPFSQSLLFSLVASYVYGPDYIRKWMIGNALLITSFNALFGVGTQLIIEKQHGTLALQIASKTKISTVLLSSAISAIFISVFSVSIGITLVSLLLGIKWTTSLIYSFVLVLFVSSFVSVSFGYIFSCFILVTSEVNLMLNLISRVLLIFSGANFPIRKLPPLLQLFSNYLPLTRSIRIAQGLMEGKVLSDYYQLIFEEFTLGIVFIIIATILLKFMEKKSRVDNSIEII